MKLLLCEQCGDVRKLPIEQWGHCECGRVLARYLGDGVAAEWNGVGRLLGIANSSLVRALGAAPRADGLGAAFEAFIIPNPCDSVTVVKP